MLAHAAEDKPAEFVQTVLIRARMAELLAERLHHPKTDAFFLAGLFSAIDALLDLPMEEALQLVPVTAEIEEALIDRTGPIGLVLDCVLEYEQANWEQVACNTVKENTIRDSYLQAIEWTNASLAHA